MTAPPRRTATSGPTAASHRVFTIRMWTVTHANAHPDLRGIDADGAPGGSMTDERICLVDVVGLTPDLVGSTRRSSSR